MLMHAINMALITSTLGDLSLMVRFLPGACQDNPYRTATVLQVVATEDIQPNDVFLVPARGTISQLGKKTEKDEKKPRLVLNPSSVTSVSAKITGAVAANATGLTTVVLPPTAWTIVTAHCVQQGQTQSR